MVQAGRYGSELSRQILKFTPDRLICFDISEYALYQLEQDLQQFADVVELIFIAGDVKNQSKYSLNVTFTHIGLKLYSMRLLISMYRLWKRIMWQKPYQIMY